MLRNSDQYSEEIAEIGKLHPPLEIRAGSPTLHALYRVLVENIDSLPDAQKVKAVKEWESLCPGIILQRWLKRKKLPPQQRQVRPSHPQKPPVGISETRKMNFTSWAGHRSSSLFPGQASFGHSHRHYSSITTCRPSQSPLTPNSLPSTAMNSFQGPTFRNLRLRWMLRRVLRH